MSKSTTPSGLPYPNPDDPVRDGSQRIRELAEAVDARGGGYLLISQSVVVTTNAQGDVTWTFPAAFATKPAVVVCNGDGTASTLIVSALDPYVSTTGGAARIRNHDGNLIATGSNVRINYTALGGKA